SLHAMAPAIPWKFLLQRACAMVLRRSRTGEPAIILHKDLPHEPLVYVLNPLVFHRKISVIFATGGRAERTVTLLLSMSVSLGSPVASFRAQRGKVLYLDYEDDVDVHARRLKAIQAGHPELADAQVTYQRAVEPLSKLTPQLVRHIQEEHISFLVV